MHAFCHQEMERTKRFTCFIYKLAANKIQIQTI